MPKHATSAEARVESSVMVGTWRDDYLVYQGTRKNSHQDLIGIATFGGDDVIDCVNPYRGQVHIFAGAGDDMIVMDVTCARGVQARVEGDPQHPLGISRNGHHVYGGDGSDVFHFRNIDMAENKVIGRLDDFDPTRDRIWVDGQEIDLSIPPEDVRIVDYLGQRWIVLGNNVFYALDGARRLSDGQEERHFAWLPNSWRNSIPDSADISYENPFNFVPFHKYEAMLGSLIVVSKTEGSFRGTAESDYIYSDKSGGSDDIVRALSGDDVIFGNTGHDRIYGNSGDDLIAGGVDEDQIYGGRGQDEIWGGDQDDRLFGKSGHDVLHGNSGEDELKGGLDDDWLSGGIGQDNLDGGRGRDTLFGDGHADELKGGPGADHLWGGWGGDRLDGGAGSDVLAGGRGADIFVFQEMGAGEQDIVMDFQDNFDRLEFRGAAAVEFFQEGEGVLVTIGSRGRVLLKDISLGQIDEWDWSLL